MFEFNEKNKHWKQDTVFLIGNGASRKDFDLEKLRSHGTIIGCNALYRDFSPNLLIAIDQKMVTEITKSGYWKQNAILFPSNRGSAVDTNVYRYKTTNFNTSGCFAMRFIDEVLKPKNCYMLGMDGYAGNVYQGTLNYNGNSQKVFDGILNNYMKVLHLKTETKFINVNIKDSWPEKCADLPKYGFMKYNEFEEMIG